MFKTACTALGLAACLAPAQALTLDFGNGPLAPEICTNTGTGLGPLVGCTSGTYISQGYGDVAGVLDVVYDAPRISGDHSLRWWAEDYNNLYGVLWAEGGDANSQAVIDLHPLDGNTVTLHGFDLGAYANTSRGTTLTVRDLASNALLFSHAGAVGSLPANLATHFTLSGVSSAHGLRIQWQDNAYNVGIDNISFSVGAVPEPGTWAMLAAGLLALGWLARRRRA
mgnify:CR=1 FL=1